jgi:hypothetical protein
VALIPHYRQVGGAPAVIGAGIGLFSCDCGNRPLISGYDPRNFLDIALQCAGCGQVRATPGLPENAPPPSMLTLVERGTASPPAAVTNETVLISREEMDRLAALYQPRSTDTDSHVISDELLDDVEVQHRYWVNEPLPAASRGFKEHALGWAVAWFRDRLQDPDWSGFSEDSDLVAATVIAAFRDLIASWSHHPLFRVMAETAAAQGGFSLHGTAMFGVAKSLAYAGNRVAFQPAEGAKPRITSFQLILGTQDQMQVAVRRLDQFEWPDGAEATAQSVRACMTEAMASVQGSINRLRPGILVLSPGAVEGTLEQLFVDCIVAALGSHGKRHRGLAAVSVIFPKIRMTNKRREVRFGYSFYPVANRNHSLGQSVRIGAREDFLGIR